MKVSLRLTCLSGSRDGETIQVQLKDDDLNEATLGRSEDCTVSFPGDPELSRRHARLLWDAKNSCWQLNDLKSTNGTYLGEFNQARHISEPVSLAYGDIFRVGRTCLCIEPSAIWENENTAVAYARAGEEPGNRE